MHPYVTLILWAVVVIAVFAALIIRQEYERKKQALNRIRRIYGKVPEREYDPGDLENISHYFRRKSGDSFVIDDITWNDLDMDHIYMLVNQTMSSPGEDVLYDMMRRPLFSQKEVDKREALIRFFSENPEKRTKLQVMISAVGKTRTGSLSDTILALESAPVISRAKHFLMLAVLILCLAALPFAPLQAFFLFFLLGVVNITIYYAGNDRKLVEAYLNCFTSLLRMLSVADQMETVDYPEVLEQMQCIREGKKVFKSFRKKAVLLTSKNDGSGDPLQILLDYMRMFFHVDLLTYNSALAEVQKKSGQIMQLIDNIGELDAAISIASFREILSLQCRPQFEVYGGGRAFIEVEDLYHPLIREAVANSIYAGRGILVTGSNASGKSTFLKNMAINSILAQTILTCTCSSYRAPFLRVMTSMALRDDLSEGDSYFIVEIKSLKRILDAAQEQTPLLCIIDEVLRGTNTIERIAASSRILEVLAKEWVLPFAATHDIELSYILEEIYENYHFEEEVQEKTVVFNYLLKTGRASTRNAIRLLDVLGYDKDIVREAKAAAADFEDRGVWKVLKGD